MTAAPASVAPEVPDDVLVAAALNGDLRAWERVVRRYQEPAYRMAYLITRESPVAEAAVLAAFIRAYRALPSLEEGAPVQPWLVRVVTSEARSKRRAAAMPRPTSRPESPPHSPSLPATRLGAGRALAALSTAEREALLTAFDLLPETDRLVLASRYLLALSAGDAAAALGISQDSIERRLREGLRRLRKRLGDA